VDGCIYIPNSQKIKERILKENHEPADIGYLGQQWMMELIKRNYWWPGIKNGVKKYIQGYFKCQQNKVQHMKKARKLYPFSFKNTRRSMEGNQHQHYWPITKIQ